MPGTYSVNRNINKSITFKGFKAQYIWWLAGGIIGTLIAFAVLYIAGVNTYLCLLFALGSIATVVWKAYGLSKKYGEHGLMKKRAASYIPVTLRSRSRSPFFKANRKL
jgi:hypothetical protein